MFPVDLFKYIIGSVPQYSKTNPEKNSYIDQTVPATRRDRYWIDDNKCFFYIKQLFSIKQSSILNSTWGIIYKYTGIIYNIPELKNCREHAELDLSISFKNFGKNFQIDIFAIKISFPEYFFDSIIEYISTLSSIYNCNRYEIFTA